MLLLLVSQAHSESVRMDGGRALVGETESAAGKIRTAAVQATTSASSRKPAPQRRRHLPQERAAFVAVFTLATMPDNARHCNRVRWDLKTGGGEAPRRAQRYPPL